MATPNKSNPILSVAEHLTNGQKDHISATIASLNGYELDYIILLAQRKLTYTRGMQLLPAELVGFIVSYLDFGSLLNCTRTCKAWKEVFTSDHVVRVLAIQNFPFQDIRCWEDLLNNFAPAYKRLQLEGLWMTWDISALGAVSPVLLSSDTKSLHPEAKKLLRTPEQHNNFLRHLPSLGHPTIPPSPGEESVYLARVRQVVASLTAGTSGSSAGLSTPTADATPAGPPRPPVFGPSRPPHLQSKYIPSAEELLANMVRNGLFESPPEMPRYITSAEARAEAEARAQQGLEDDYYSDSDEYDDMDLDEDDDEDHPFWDRNDHPDVVDDLQAFPLADNRIVCLYFEPRTDDGRTSKYIFFDTITGHWFHSLDGSTHPELVDRGFPGSEQISGYFPLISINLGKEWFVFNFQTGVLDAMDINPGNSSIFHFGNDIVTIDTESKVTFWYWSDAGKFSEARPPLLGKKQHVISRGTYDIMGLLGELPYTPADTGRDLFGDHFNHIRPVSHVVFHPKIPGKFTLFFATRPAPNATTEWHWKATPATIRILHFNQYKFVSGYKVDVFNTMHPTNSNCWDWWEPQAMFTEGLWAIGHEQMENNGVQPDFTKMKIYDIVSGQVSTLEFPLITPNDFSRISFNNMYSGINSMSEFIPMASQLCIHALLDSFGETLSPGARSFGTRPFCLPAQGARYSDVRVPNMDPDFMLTRAFENEMKGFVTMPFTKVEVFERYMGPKDAPYEIPVWEKVPINEVD